MITIIFAPPRFGKTALMSHLLTQVCFDFDRRESMYEEILNKNLSGFSVPCPEHCVSANYSLNMWQYGCSECKSRTINPFRLGFKNPYVETHFNFPYEAIGIDEAQIYLNSRMAQYYPAWQSRWYEAHGHNNLDIFLATQRPGLVDVNIRELASFVEVVNLKVKNDIYGDPCRLVWQVRSIPYARMYDKYVSSGGQDKTCFKEHEIVADYDVFSVYDSQSCKPKFYDGYLKYVESDVQFDTSKIDYSSFALDDESAMSYIKYLETFKDDYPENFYVKKLISEEEKNKKVKRSKTA